ncbi:MAG: hypothetical protein Unbinned4834contig1000_62 [Prokaryotic dsDNA virus sp.]|nr:MAG: hypothetical protein Unbinned4834contig1000_62 [Prokaryotic dsDNA virus sp.]|tara:strand:- start:13648 stop:14547 length:900 start_codon:yes stop_codon:yes gene_type:complete
MPEEMKEEPINEIEDDAVEVELETEEAVVEEPAPETETEAEPEDDEHKDYSKSVEKRISKLTAKMREAERREKAAIEYAQSVQQQLEEQKQRATSLDTSYVTEFENRVNTEEELLKQHLKRANDVGDTDAQFEANKRLATLATQRERLDYVKAEQARRAAQQQQPAQPEQAAQQQQPAQPPDPKAEAWAEKNDWFGVDEPMTITALYMHKQMTEQEGYDPQSDEYYAEVDKRLRAEFPHKFENAPKKKSGPRVAGASRSNTSGNKTSVKLTPSQVAISKKLGITEKQYAQSLLRMQQNT